MAQKEVNKLLLEKIFIFLLAFIGFLTTIQLAVIYYNSNFNPFALPSFCSINGFIDCDGVAHTIHSQFLGVPLAYWGMFLYVFIIFLLFVDKLKEIKFLKFLEVFKNPLAYISALGFISFVISMVLAGISIFEIKKVCILCVFTYVLNLIIGIIATDFSKGFSYSFKTSVLDFIDALKVKEYLASFIFIVLLASGVLTYTATSYKFTPQVKLYNSLTKYLNMKTNPYSVKGNVLGDADAKTIVYIYTDYRCPICRVYNVITHKAVKELGGFKMIHKNLPLDNVCNRHVPQPFHVGACMLARYAIAAENQGHFWDMNSAIFDQQPQNEDDILKMAEKMGLDTFQLREDANSDATKKRIEQDIKSADELKINGTPTIVINGQLYIGLKPYYELKDILIKAGAVERKK